MSLLRSFRAAVPQGPKIPGLLVSRPSVVELVPAQGPCLPIRAIRDRQDDSFERQEASGRDGRKDDEEWLKMTRGQRRSWKDKRLGGRAWSCSLDQEEEMGRTKEVWCQPPGAGVAFAARRRRQAFARPLVGPPNTLPVLSAPGWWICLFQT